MLKTFSKYFWLPLFSLFIFPHILVLFIHPNRKLLKNELNTWIQTLRLRKSPIIGFILLLFFIKEYRNIFYLRIGGVGKILNIYIKKLNVLHIDTPSNKIGCGLIFQHGFSTIVNAHEIGENCQIWHNVTVGINQSGTGNKPTILNNVKICAGSIVIGKIVIGNNVTIGAGSVVTKSVPDNCIVVGNPARIIKRNGKIEKEIL